MKKTEVEILIGRFLILTIMMSFFSLGMAQFGGGTGSENNPWQIETAEHLHNITNFLGQVHSNKHYILMSDIDLNQPPWNQNQGWEPIGYAIYDNDTILETIPFSGNFNGNGHIISNLQIYRGTTNGQGLFGNIKGATIYNLSLIDYTIYGLNYVGSLAGFAEDSEVSDIFVSGEITGNKSVGGVIGYQHNDSHLSSSNSNSDVSGVQNVGGLVGVSNNLSSIIESYSTSEVQCSINTAGGVVGHSNNGSLVKNCHNTGNVSGEVGVGGLVGHNDNNSIIQFSYNRGDVTGDTSLGGVVGASSINAVINSSFNTGTVTGTGYVGGLVGITLAALVSNCYSTGEVSGFSDVGGLIGINVSSVLVNSYSTGRVTGDVNVGGLIGNNNDSSITNSYWNTETSAQSSSAGGLSRTTQQMTYPSAQNTYIDWEFDDVWKDDIFGFTNDGYPWLGWYFSDKPHIATNPLPADRATRVPLTLDNLSWTYVEDEAFVNPRGFLVYINTCGDFSNENYGWVDYIEGEENYSISSIIPELNYATGYYWQVIPTTRNPNEESLRKSRIDQDISPLMMTSYFRGDSVNCPIWFFKTEPYPIPDIASNPLPNNGATEISYRLNRLAWFYLENDDYTNPVGFKLYFNTSGEFKENDNYIWVPYIEGQQVYFSESILPGELNILTTYYWQVIPTINRPDERVSVHIDGINTRAEKIKDLRDDTNNRTYDGNAQDVPIWSFTTGITTEIETAELPLTTRLVGNYPNPFNPVTVIMYDICSPTNVELEIFNLMGQKVRTLRKDEQQRGNYRIMWDGKDDRERQLNSGVYFYRLKTDRHNEIRKMMLIK